MKLKHLSKLLVLGALFNSAPANALVLLQQVSVLTGVDYDTNPTLATSNEVAIWRYTAAPKYTASLVDDRNRWFATAGLNLQRSSNKAISENRQDPSISAGWQHEYEKGFYNLTVDYTKASSRLNEFTTTGIVDKDGSATSKSISASWSRLLTERLNLSLAGQYLQIDYTGSGFTNYNTKSLNSSLSYQLNEKLNPFLQVAISDLSSEGGGSQSRISQSYLVGTTAQINPNLDMSASLGLNHQQASGNGWVANSTLTYLGEKYNLQGTLSRNVTASGLGQFQETDNISLRYSYDLSDKSRAGTDFNWSSNASTGGNETRQLGGWYTKELSDLWQFKLSLNLKELKNNTQSANSSIFGIRLIYNTLDF